MIDPLVKEGRMPALASLLEGGIRAGLRSTVPPLSAPAWVSFMTGTDPGEHGVFHFRTTARGVLGSELVGPWAYRGRTIFDEASAGGREVLALRVPMTYPPWPIRGVMVSGFPTPDPRVNHSEPPEVGEAMPPLFAHGAMRGLVAGADAQIANLEHYIERSTGWLVDAVRSRRYELVCSVNNVTDWAAHRFWRLSDPQAPGYERHDVAGRTPLEHLYEKVDASLGAILEAVPDDALVVVLSDHGTGPRASKRFDTDAWLRELGLREGAPRRSGRSLAGRVVERASEVLPKRYWLWRHAPASVRERASKLRDGTPPVTSASRAYGVRVDHHIGGVNVNLAGREGDGAVLRTEYETVRDRVLSAATELVDDTGRRIVRAAHRREDLYAGEHVDRAPDVVLELDEAFEVGRGRGAIVSAVDPSRPTRSSATHRPVGILAMRGPDVREGVDLGEVSLLDVPPTLLWALGLPVPGRMRGRVLTEAFSSALVEAHPVRRGDDAEAATGGSAYSEEEEAQMTAHLEDLGYL